DLKGRHLLLVGRPAANAVTARFASALPVHFGPNSVTVRGEVFAHPDTAGLGGAGNPHAPRHSAAGGAARGGRCAGGAGAAAGAARRLGARGLPAGEVVLLRRGLPPRARVVPRAEKVRAGKH